MIKRAILILLITFAFSHCKKEYVCECSNPVGLIKSYSMTTSKNKASKKCSDSSKEYQNIPFSEAACTLK